MSQNWLSSNLWPKTTNVASVASNGLSDIKTGKTDTSGTFQSLLAGKLGDKIQSSSMASKLNNSLGEMRASKKLDPPPVRGNVKSLDQVESKPKTTDSFSTNEVEKPMTVATNKSEAKISDSNVSENEKTTDQLAVEESKPETDPLVEEVVKEISSFAQYIIERAPETPELEQLMTELGTKLEELTAMLVQSGKPELLLKQMKEVLESVMSIQTLSSSSQTSLPTNIKTILDQLTKTLEKATDQNIQARTFEMVLKDLSTVVKEISKGFTNPTESAKEVKHEVNNLDSHADAELNKPISAESKDQKTSSSGQGNDPGTNKNKFSEVVKVSQDNKQSTEVKTGHQSFVGEMNAKVESASISFGKTETAIGKTSLQQNILDQLINSPRMQVKQTELGTIMTMKLNPEVLGNVEIKLEIIKNVLQAEINVENMIVKGAIESNLTDLKNALSDKGYQVENLNVSVSKDGQDHRGQQHRQNEQAQRYVLDEDETTVSKSFKMTSLNEEGTIDYLG